MIEEANTHRFGVAHGQPIIQSMQGILVSDAALTIEQCRKLMHELATNDGFRRRYEDKPAAALIELGIPHEVVVNLKASCLVPKKLANKEIFQAANKALDDETAQRYASFSQPTLAFGSAR